MSKKKMLTLLLFVVVVGVFAFVSADLAQASKRPPPENQPPICYPIEFSVPGYWGRECIDLDQNIVSAVLFTNSPHTLVWNNAYAQMIVELEEDTVIYWSVCDSFGVCQKGGYP